MFNVKSITPRCIAPVFAMLIAVIVPPAHADTDPVGTTFTYQGQLTDAGEPATGTVDLVFRLFDQSENGTPLGVLVADDFPLGDNGRFTIDLDFGDEFTGGPRWLEIDVNAVTLSPRQPIMAAPHAMVATTTANVPTKAVVGNYSGITGVGTLDSLNVTGNVGIGTTNPLATLHVATGTSGMGLHLPGLRVFQDPTSPIVVGGSIHNDASATGATISGGGSSISPNQATAAYSTVGGGSNNIASGTGATVSGGGSFTGPNQATSSFSTVGGGSNNTASGANASVLGGLNNTASGNRAVVSGGTSNTASGFNSTVGGGNGNQAIGANATVPGGNQNAAEGNYSFAAGRNAKAMHAGAFVWGDSEFADLESTAPDQFLIRAAGGVGIGTSSPNANLHVTGDGSGAVMRLDNGGGGSATNTGLVVSGVQGSGRAASFYGITSSSLLLVHNDGSGQAAQFDGNVEFKNGNVGIGTNNPQAPLEVAGRIRSSGPDGGSFQAYNPNNQSASVRLDWHEDAARLRIGGNGPGANGGFDIQRIGNQSMLRIDGDGNVGIGNSNPQTRLHVNGTTRTNVIEITGADLAEEFPFSEPVEPGMVVEIDPNNPGQLCLASGAYNRRVAGVIAGANEFSTGVVLGRGSGNEFAAPVALSGRVYVHVDATERAVKVGDMLTTSDRPGYAMGVTDYSRMHGAVIGKAMTGLAKGETGLVLVLINLQ